MPAPASGPAHSPGLPAPLPSYKSSISRRSCRKRCWLRQSRNRSACAGCAAEPCPRDTIRNGKFPRRSRRPELRGLNALRAKIHRGLHRFLHRAAKAIRRSIWSATFSATSCASSSGVLISWMSILICLPLRHLRDLLGHLLDFGAFASDHDAGTRGVDGHADAVPGALDDDLRDGGELQLLLHVVANLDVASAEMPATPGGRHTSANASRGSPPRRKPIGLTFCPMN